jgi:hypothetical protein
MPQFRASREHEFEFVHRWRDMCDSVICTKVSDSLMRFESCRFQCSLEREHGWTFGLHLICGP